MATTTIQITTQLKDKLENLKLFQKESYEEVIWDLVEDSMELSEETKRNIITARKEIESGKFITHEELKKDLGL